MTNLNESLAIFMGLLEPNRHNADRYWLMPGGEVIFKTEWTPTTDLNQAALVIKKLGARGLDRVFMRELVSQLSGPDADVWFNEDTAYNALTASPLALCQAAEKVIKGGESC